MYSLLITDESSSDEGQHNPLTENLYKLSGKASARSRQQAFLIKVLH
jgi:hypothetical protein